MLNIKYRPKNYKEIIGNPIIIKSLLSLASSSHLMFEGEYGLGKTTFAYIEAFRFGANENSIKDINCVHIKGVNEAREIVSDFYT